MVLSTESAVDFDLAEFLEQEYEDAVVYGDIDGETVLHEGRVRILANGWVKLPTGRLLSPEAVHHIDTH
ncbi:hypothetical protein [Halostagnicola sp. A-GB9-2]|uniref:hypothetical protein n=1 Tax=Halostagnicola sp. A-GB9-2 TaxID=3048066 RepID=UPI0024C0595B|nr:hypothetical protein [Halostagnicola sp. A-GB9-2]MDJ1432012.1 hypothetical protein [Halostagnicola sp. A-GB9-2]